MTLISHYVVTFNHETGKFAIDDDTADVVFSDGMIYDDDSGEWISDSERVSQSHNRDMKGYHALLEMLEKSNRKKK